MLVVGKFAVSCLVSVKWNGSRIESGKWEWETNIVLVCDIPDPGLHTMITDVPTPPIWPGPPPWS